MAGLNLLGMKVKRIKTEIGVRIPIFLYFSFCYQQARQNKIIQPVWLDYYIFYSFNFILNIRQNTIIYISFFPLFFSRARPWG
jgi:hypothetical protein